MDALVSLELPITNGKAGAVHGRQIGGRSSMRNAGRERGAAYAG